MLEPLFNAPSPIPIHGVAALIALATGALQFAMPKGTLIHKSLGYTWIVIMLVVALTSFFINEFRWVGPFGPIHLLSLLVLWGLGEGLYYARKGEIAKHRKNMRQVYFFSLILAGLFTLTPGRVMHEVLFGAIS